MYVHPMKTHATLGKSQWTLEKDRCECRRRPSLWREVSRTGIAGHHVPLEVLLSVESEVVVDSVHQYCVVH